MTKLLGKNVQLFYLVSNFKEAWDGLSNFYGQSDEVHGVQIDNEFVSCDSK